MTLTKENMESRAGLMSHSIFRDIARMDDSQLALYIRLAFKDSPAYTFLPEPFWDYWFDASVHGPSRDGRERSSPANFFAGFHNILASVARGTFRIGDWTEPRPDFEYRPRFRRIIDGILQECLEKRGTIKIDYQMLASFAVESVDNKISRERKKMG